jgi:glycosyltransferase involved in cell wall biosynthesis
MIGGNKRRIVHVVPKLNPAGGPAGYAYRLKTALAAQDNGDFEVEFLESPGLRNNYRMNLEKYLWFIEARARTNGNSSEFVRKAANRALAAITGLEQRLRPDKATEWANVDAYTCYCAPPDLNRAEFQNADLVIFHAVLAASVSLRSRHRKTPMVAVMPHSPTPIVAEMACHVSQDILLDEVAADRRFIGLLAEELRLYGMADVIVAPCSAALDGYRSLGGRWAETFADSRIATCLTGTGPPPVRSDKTTWRQRLGVGDTELLAAYVGRYHVHKGFDVLGAVMKELNRRMPGKFTLACAGGFESKEKVDGIVHVGFTDDAGGLMSAADFVVIPCRYAYFDIGALECCALGRPLLLTRVGGHRELARLIPAIKAVDFGVEALVQGFIELSNDSNRAQRGVEIGLAYEKLFSPRAFARNHLQLYEEILARSPIGRAERCDAQN